MRAKLGRDARLAEVTDRGEYAAAAVASACDSRGHWLRYAMRGVLDPETSSPFLVLSGPGMDSDAAPGLTRPDDDQGALELSEALRARCVEETARVGEAFLLDASASRLFSRRRIFSPAPPLTRRAGWRSCTAGTPSPPRATRPSTPTSPGTLSLIHI